MEKLFIFEILIQMVNNQLFGIIKTWIYIIPMFQNIQLQAPYILHVFDICFWNNAFVLLTPKLDLRVGILGITRSDLLLTMLQRVCNIYLFLNYVLLYRHVNPHVNTGCLQLANYISEWRSVLLMVRWLYKIVIHKYPKCQSLNLWLL